MNTAGEKLANPVEINSELSAAIASIPNGIYRLVIEDKRVSAQVHNGSIVLTEFDRNDNLYSSEDRWPRTGLPTTGFTEVMTIDTTEGETSGVEIVVRHGPGTKQIIQRLTLSDSTSLSKEDMALIGLAREVLTNLGTAEVEPKRKEGELEEGIVGIRAALAKALKA